MDADVLVIGAGASGLAAARALADAGRRVIVPEARDRIGGRVWTDRSFAAIPVERGAELAHELKIADKGPGDFHILDGYDRALALLADRLDIRLGTAVTAIRWGDDGVAVETRGQGDKQTIELNDRSWSPGLLGSQSLRARHAIVTLPLALLKTNAVAFDPPLPA